MLRFGGEDGPSQVDPTVKTENIGADCLEATALGLKNLDRVTDLLVPATTRVGEDDTVLREIYGSIMSHRANWLRAVAAMVGGVVETRSMGRTNENFSRLPKEKQQAAVRFLLDNGLMPPRKLLQPTIVNRFKYLGVADDIMNQQKGILTSLLSNRRFQQMKDAEVLYGDNTYTALELLNDVQDGVWSELKAGQPQVDAIRRALQRAYLDHMKQTLVPAPAAAGGPPRGPAGGDTDFRPIARAALQELAKRLDAAIPQTKDAMTKLHLEDSRHEIELILNPKA
jgi:hypothetical protein